MGGLEVGELIANAHILRVLLDAVGLLEIGEVQEVHIGRGHPAAQTEVLRTVAYVDSPVTPLRGPRLAPNRIGRPETQWLVATLARAKHPRARDGWSASPGSIHAGGVFG